MAPGQDPAKILPVMTLAWAGPVSGDFGDAIASLRDHPNVDLRHIASTGSDTVRVIRSGTVDAIITPIVWADITRAIRVSASLSPGGSPSLIAATGTTATPFLVKAVVNGFDGAIETNVPADVMVGRIRDVIDGVSRLEDDPSLRALGVTPGLLAKELVIDDPDDRYIADLVATGMPDEDIARAMDVPVQRVRNRIEHLLAVNSLSYRTQLAVIQASLVNVPDFA